ncbi:PilZ domain-containing protein [Erythrobacter mangrovi]|uniref:PilZ domain-containing protein n=1 Tax=Erythrobacter mangrovi TaxID=2739433 RepID=A0A7D4C1W7_9SPHN|nr:PilZ domain-containing protein [Erythrobacter mangrovi]QKG70065.1 PilZ domain-containing protein [Erythrobacter mangrovi]
METLLANWVTEESRRKEARTNTFVMGTILTDAMSAPVRIRNLSPNGALVSGPDLPQAGERCRIRRGSLSVSGRIMRRNEEHAGLLFERSIEVQNWLAAGHSRQVEVDRVVQEAKHRYPVADTHHLMTNATTSAATTRDSLLDIADQLDRLADSLSDDDHVIAKFLDRLQILDIASQRLRALG